MWSCFYRMTETHWLHSHFAQTTAIMRVNAIDDDININWSRPVLQPNRTHSMTGAPIYANGNPASKYALYCVFRQWHLPKRKKWKLIAVIYYCPCPCPPLSPVSICVDTCGPGDHIELIRKYAFHPSTVPSWVKPQGQRSGHAYHQEMDNTGWVASRYVVHSPSDSISILVNHQVIRTDSVHHPGQWWCD